MMVETSGAGAYKDHPLAVPGREYVSDRNSILQPKIDAGLCEPISVAEREAAMRFNETYAQLFGSSARRVDDEQDRRQGIFAELSRLLGFR